MQTMVGFMPCLQCNGRGVIVSPDYQQEQAANRGYADGVCIRGKVELSNGNYDSAFEAFSEAFEHDSKEAIAFLGVCFELGMGIDVDRKMAVDLYNYGYKLNVAECVEAVKRINSSGFWAANDDTRKRFSQLIRNVMNVTAGESMSVPHSGSGGHHSSSGNICSGCGGTGDCTGCGGTGKMKSTAVYTDGHTMISDCPVCKGTGRCGVCRGSGRL